jgi:hypothetical protein
MFKDEHRHFLSEARGILSKAFFEEILRGAKCESPCKVACRGFFTEGVVYMVRNVLIRRVWSEDRGKRIPSKILFTSLIIKYLPDILLVPFCYSCNLLDGKTFFAHFED